MDLTTRAEGSGPPARDRLLPVSAALAACLIFGVIQFAGGAYRAEWDAHPDESAHFMTGLMIRDFLVQLPLSHPLDWMEQYYVHYPRIYLGRWPPLFHLLEGIWWLVAPPSRFTGMLLAGLLGLASAVLFYRLVRRVAPAPVAMAAMVLLIAAPVFQRAAAQSMAELLSLLLVILFLDALTRFLEERSGGNAVWVGLWCGLALLVKGTGACLAPAPFLALLIAGHGRSTPRRALAAIAGIVVVTGGFWHLLSEMICGNSAGWSGIRLRMPWSIGLMIQLAGPGFLGVALAGMVSRKTERPPAVAASTAVLVSTAAVSFFLRAMCEHRHFIVALPGVLLLGASFLHRVLGDATLPRRLAAGALAAGALALFPWTYYRQRPAGYEALARQLKQPARMLVSASEGWAEGAWVVTASLRESRPSSVVARAAKVLGETDRGQPRDAAWGERWLERMAFETVVLDEHLPGLAPAYHRLLRETLARSPAWKECGRAGLLRAYCRIDPPTGKREPLRVDVTRHLGRVLEEK